MKIARDFLLICTVLALPGSAVAQCSQPMPGKPTVISLTLSSVQGTVKAGSPVLMNVVLTNISDHDVTRWVENAEGQDQYGVHVSDDKGGSPMETEHGKIRNGHVDPSLLKPGDLAGSGGCLTLKAGKKMTSPVNVSKLYDLSKPGKYEIQVNISDPESFGIVKSNKVTVTVVP